jgi:pantoate--beta-alanine ligase
MEIHTTVESLRAACDELRHHGERIALVPTMGNLHDGHIDLMRLGHIHADAVVASIFVNRLQFGPAEDFDQYPRTFEADCSRLTAAGVAHLFAPTEDAMYPRTQSYHLVPAPEHADILEGASRPGHFRGVATVVLKLFNIIQPDVALFGRKDYQQLIVLRAMVEQLALPITIIAGDTVRASDGLALSSRNAYLSASERAEAPRLFRQLSAIAAAVRAGEHDFTRLAAATEAELGAHGWMPDYIAIRRCGDLQPPRDATDKLVALGAARLGKTRLIDNLEI